jgi:REP element-mobilizing transposase RayT
MSDYGELVEYLNARDSEMCQRKLHRLPITYYSESECGCFITICARQHGEPFADAELARTIVDSLLWQRNREKWLLYCYCLMPDHLHFIARLLNGDTDKVNAGARGRTQKGILDHVSDFKKYTTSQIWWKRGGTGALWQKSSYDHIIRWPDSAEAAVQYVLNNPVRKGLVEHWDDYPFSGVVDSL